MWIERRQYRILGKALAGLRKRAGQTQDVLASRLKKPQSFVSNYESGQRRIDILEFLQIAEVLGAEPRAAFAEILRKLKAASRR